MSGRQTSLRRYSKIVLLVLFIGALCLPVVTVPDLSVGTTVTNPKPVDASMDARTILTRARTNTYTANHQSVRYVHNTSDPNSELKAVWFFRYEPVERQYYNKLFVAPDSPTENWTLNEVYMGEHVAGERLGNYGGTTPRYGASPTDAATRSGPIGRGFDIDSFETYRNDFEERPNALRVLNESDEYLVVGARTPERYAAYQDLPDGVGSLNGSYYEVHVHKRTGRIHRIEHRQDFVTASGRHVSIYVETRVSYGEYPVERPTWVRWNPLELVYDALVYQP
jgi:hypothetical protein